MQDILRATLADRAVLEEARLRSLAFARAHRASDAVRHAEAALAGLDAADAEAVARQATLLLDDASWVRVLLAPMVAALDRDPWFEPPLRVQREGGRIGAVLFEHPVLTITGSVVAPPARPADSLVVPGRMSVVRYQRGSGQILLWRTEVAGPDFRAASAPPLVPAGAVRLRDGLVRRIDGRTHAQAIEGARAPLVMITATIAADAAPFARDFDRASGRLLRVAALDHGASRAQLLLAYLRAARRVDAAPAFEIATRAPAYFLRWAAMREWLALDARAALPRLRELAHDTNAEVRTAARATLPQVEAALACR
ncbi:MAG: hypothetical protein A4S16_14310 [Proteobacteria bacterium SG_bin6]|nr:MAG: hypothetical protein A4S16_14310 [Proteobacteria bacterium SG_bin6]